MKPSDRIVEIQKENCKKVGVNPEDLRAMPYLTLSLIQYLDEEWEKKKFNITSAQTYSCNHQWTDKIPLGLSPVPTRICEKCGLYQYQPYVGPAQDSNLCSHEWGPNYARLGTSCIK